MPTPNIVSHNDISSSLRHAGSYSYLNNELNAYWIESINVCHVLLEKFSKKHGCGVIYYQDQFGEDFISAQTNNWITQPVNIINEFSLNGWLNCAERKVDPSWIKYESAIALLKQSPRGNQILVQMVSGDYAHWEARIHFGGGEISTCSTMTRYKERPPIEAAIKCMLSYEAYLARCQAKKEIGFLANYAKIYALNLQDGMKLRDVEVLHPSGKMKKISFVIDSIAASGVLRLEKGALRGSGNSFSCWHDASMITAENLVPVKVPVIKGGKKDSMELF